MSHVAAVAVIAIAVIAGCWLLGGLKELLQVQGVSRMYHVSH